MNPFWLNSVFKEREKNMKCSKVLGKVVYTEKGYVSILFLNTTISADTCTLLSLPV